MHRETKRNKRVGASSTCKPKDVRGENSCVDLELKGAT